MSMSVSKRGEGTWDVSSESSSRTYIVAWGTEGDFYSCQCTNYAIGRNKAGGLGYKYVCKHIREVERIEPMAKLDAGRIDHERAEQMKADAAASLLRLERALRDPVAATDESEPAPDEAPKDVAALLSSLEQQLRG